MGAEQSTDVNAQEAITNLHNAAKQESQARQGNKTSQNTVGSTQSTSSSTHSNAPQPTVNDVSQSNPNENDNIISKSSIEEYFQCDFPVKIDPSVFRINKEIIQLRRYFHQTPELSFKEIDTSKNITRYLKTLGLEVYDNIAKTGVIGVLRGTGSTNNSDGPCILLRADMDALPIEENNNEISYKSLNKGVMHACGHDCHMAILLSVARILSQPEYCRKLNGTIKFCFQPAEEGLAGAYYMIEEGKILEHDQKNDIPRVDQVYGLHVWSYEKFGKCVVRQGPLMAGSSTFLIKILGLGGHGAEPKGTNDAILASTQLILQLHTIISRDLSPLEEGVITVGKVISGNRGNVIAESSELHGTFRWLSNDIYKCIIRRIEECLKGIELSFNVKTSISYSKIPYPVTINEENCTYNIGTAVSTVLPEGIIKSNPTMAAEDFSFFLNKRPGCFFFLGCGIDGNNIYAHHKPDFKVDERCLITGVQIFVNLILQLLQPNMDIKDTQTVRVPLKPNTIVPTPPSDTNINNNSNNDNINVTTNNKDVNEEKTESNSTQNPNVVTMGNGQ